MEQAVAKRIERINEHWALANQRPVVSFEFFPPNSPEMLQTLWQTVARLSCFDAAFASVTYGANCSTRDRTHELITHLKQRTSLNLVPHLTCINAQPDEIALLVHRYQQLGLNHIVALRGDVPEGQSGTGSTWQYATDLVKYLRTLHIGDISVAGYPEVHPEATDAQADFEHLRAKVDAGATQVITQFFFDNCAFLRFRDKCAAHGITQPIIPGILPIQSFKQVKRFAKACGTHIPSWLAALYAGLENDLETQRMISASIALEQIKVLFEAGVTQFHLYTLNRAPLIYTICHTLGLYQNPAMQRTA